MSRSAWRTRRRSAAALAQVRHDLGAAREALVVTYASTSWRLTAPLRALARWSGMVRKK